MSLFQEYFEESYKYKYSKYLEEDDDDDEKSKDENTPSKEAEHHLSKMEIRRIVTMVMSKLQEFPKLKKCCDYIDLSDKDHYNDDGERVSSFDDYYSDKPGAFIKLMDGDVFSGYPNFRNGGNEDYEKDEKSFVKSMNEFISSRNIKAKFMVGKGKEDEAISFGVKSTK